VDTGLQAGFEGLAFGPTQPPLAACAKFTREGSKPLTDSVPATKPEPSENVHQDFACGVQDMLTTFYYSQRSLRRPDPSLSNDLFGAYEYSLPSLKDWEKIKV
jgi:hypothetical protein